MPTISGTSSQSSPVSSTTSSAGKSLSSSDFLKLLVTELKNQDPTKPMSNQDMLNQVSQISSLQSTSELSSTLKDLTSKNQISTGAALIGKAVAGLDADGAVISGLVSSVNVQGKDIMLQLDNGKELNLTQVTSVAPTTTKAA